MLLLANFQTKANFTRKSIKKSKFFYFIKRWRNVSFVKLSMFSRPTNHWFLNIYAKALNLEKKSFEKCVWSRTKKVFLREKTRLEVFLSSDEQALFAIEPKSNSPDDFVCWSSRVKRSFGYHLCDVNIWV